MESVDLGDSITLECDALALPAASYFWFLVDCGSETTIIQSITSGNGLRVSGGNLTVEQAMRSHRGCYKCLANNSLEGSDIDRVTRLKVSGKQNFILGVTYFLFALSLSLSLSLAPPLPPTHVMVNEVGSSWMNVVWTKVDNYPAIITYILGYKLKFSSEYLTMNISPFLESHNFTELYPNATYEVQVYSDSPVGIGIPDPPINATTLPGVPVDGLNNTPFSVAPVGTSPNNITVYWTVPEVRQSSAKHVVTDDMPYCPKLPNQWLCLPPPLHAYLYIPVRMCAFGLLMCLRSGCRLSCKLKLRYFSI